MGCVIHIQLLDQISFIIRGGCGGLSKFGAGARPTLIIGVVTSLTGVIHATFVGPVNGRSETLIDSSISSKHDCIRSWNHNTLLKLLGVLDNV